MRRKFNNKTFIKFNNKIICVMCTIFSFVQISIFSSKKILIGYLLLYSVGRAVEAIILCKHHRFSTEEIS